MFGVVAVNDVEVLTKLAKECGGEYLLEYTLNTVLIVGDRPCGICMMRYVDKSVIRLEWVGLCEDMRKKGYGDFLTRASINKAIDICETIQIGYVDDYFLKFGFKKEGKIMTIESKKVFFPSKCNHNQG